MQQLEARLGTRLLHRTTRTVRLTSDGEQFLASAKALLADAEQLQSMFQPAASGLKSKLIERSVADDGVMLESRGEIARLIDTGTRPCVLAEDLILGGGLHAGDQRRRNSYAHE